MRLRLNLNRIGRLAMYNGNTDSLTTYEKSFCFNDWLDN